VQLSMEQWKLLGQGRALNSLTSLELNHSPAPVGFLQHLTRLPHLSSLSIGSGCLEGEERLADLPQLLNLTQLRLSMHGASSAVYESIGPCTQLKQLALRGISSGDAVFLDMLHSPGLRATLQSLQLDRASLDEAWRSSEERQQLRAAFSCQPPQLPLQPRNAAATPRHLSATHSSGAAAATPLMRTLRRSRSALYPA